MSANECKDALPVSPEACDVHLGLEQNLLTLAEAARQLPRIDGKKVALPTLWRWCRRGLKGRIPPVHPGGPTNLRVTRRTIDVLQPTRGAGQVRSSPRQAGVSR